MRRAAGAILLSVGWAACAVSAPEAPPRRVAAGQPVSLKVGESAESADGRLRFGFERVSGDSRCPKNAKCVWAGDAVVRIWLQRDGAPKETRELHTATGGAKEGPDPGVRLLRLDPVPVVGQALDPGDYVATLALGAAASER